MVSDGSFPRVQAHAAAALVNFFEECPVNVLEPYLDAVVQKLEQVLSEKMQQLAQKGSRLVLEQILTTIATVADTAEAKFVTYYDRFMPSLKYIFENAVSKEYRLLRGKCIECISLIGLAVGKDKVCFHCKYHFRRTCFNSMFSHRSFGKCNNILLS